MSIRPLYDRLLVKRIEEQERDPQRHRDSGLCTGEASGR